ncbi:hypothetical protein HHI36_019866 [Cryptolaemus montrouzieri]|uniref:Uncharacterized protein n=1 Tax=Cryptolaemus montrouzieri TaxID=559131 RepID=A0ABD2N9C6_9CUCU
MDGQERGVYIDNFPQKHNGDHRDESHSTDSYKLKPQWVVDYGANMGAVDKTDMLLSSTECIRESSKSGGGERSAEDTPMHFPSLLPETSKEKHPARVCINCSKHKNEKTAGIGARFVTYHSLCVVPCFEQFHTLKNY